MAYQVRILLLALLLGLTACHRTEVPGSYRSGVSKGSYNYATYTVRRGDTLYSIGRRFGVDHKLLARRNHIGWPYTIYVGQELYLTRSAPRSQYMPVPRKRKHASSKKSSKPVKSPSRTASASHYQAPAVNHTASLRMRWPTKGPVTSSFGRDGSRTHDGIDIGAREGSPVYAAASGEVVYSDHRLSGYGHLIIVRHGHDLFTAYAHNQRNLVRKGDKVKSGDIIARVGKTGRTNGHANLHFEVRRGQTPVNPLSYLPKR